MTGHSIQKLSPSIGDYLETAFWIAAVHGSACFGEIAKAMHVWAFSITSALRVLAPNRYINYMTYTDTKLITE
jgi:Mn-dependent DtxR family transcriptional regulator